MPEKAADLYGNYGSVPDPVQVDGSGARPLSVRATPADFGAQVGQAVTQLGDTGVKAGHEMVDYATQLQGMVNETLATNAETEYTAKLGALTGQYKSLEGTDAVKALPKYLADVQSLRPALRANLPGGAARSFDLLALRHEGFAIGEANTYAAAQVREGDYDAAARAHANSYGPQAAQTGYNDEQFGMVTGDMKSHLARMYQSQPGFLGQDRKTGEPVFDKTPYGQLLAQDYKTQLSDSLSKAWVSRFTPLMQQDVVAAFNKYQDEKGNIPEGGRVALDAMFQPRLEHNEMVAGVTNSLGKVSADYTNQLYNPSVAAMSIDDAISRQEHPGGKAEPVSIDGAVGNHQIMPATFARYARPGEDINNPADNDAVYQRIMTDLKTRYPDDPARVATAYFSGPGNVSAPGSSTPWKSDYMDGNGKLVSSYVSDVVNRMGGNPKANNSYATTVHGSQLSVADYYRAHYADIMQDAQDWAEKQHPGDTRFAAKTVAYTEQRLNNIIKQQELSYKVDTDTVMQAVNGSLTNGKRPTSPEELAAINPQVRQAWENMSANNSTAYETITNRMLTANSKGENKELKEYGSDYIKTAHAIIKGDITSPNQILSLYASDDNADDSRYTTAGIEKLNALFKTPPGDLKVQTAALEGVKAQFTSHYQDSIDDPKGIIAYNNALPLMYKAWEEGLTKGNTAYEMADPTSPKWIGYASKALWISDAQQKINALTSTPEPKTPVLPKVAEDESAFAMKQKYIAETDPVKKAAIKQRMIQLFNLQDDEPTVKTPVSE